MALASYSISSLFQYSSSLISTPTQAYPTKPVASHPVISVAIQQVPDQHQKYHPNRPPPPYAHSNSCLNALTSIPSPFSEYVPEYILFQRESVSYRVTITVTVNVELEN